MNTPTPATTPNDSPPDTAALKLSEEHFRAAFDHAAIGKALVALDGRFTHVNRSLCQMLGYSQRELVQRNFQSLTHPDDLHADLALANRLLAGEIPSYQLNKRYFHKFGHIVSAHLTASLVRDDVGNPLYFIAQIQDQRHPLENALLTSEAEHLAMFQLAGVGKTQTDLATGRFLKVNLKFCEIIGYTPEEAVTLSFHDITPPEDRAKSRNHARDMLDGKLADLTMEKRYLRKNGDTIWVCINAAVIRDLAGKPTRAVATIVDITDRKHAEIFEADRSKALEMIVQDSSSEDVLLQLAQTVERQIPDALAAFMLIRDGELTLIAEHLPHPWRESLSQSALRLCVPLSENARHSPDSLGVTFPQSDPLWQNLRTLAESAAIAACWASPLQGADGTPLGLLTAFLNTPRNPSSHERQTLAAVAKLAAVAVEHHTTTHQLAHWVRHDALTGLPNRIQFHDRLEQALASQNNNLTALLMIDIDQFKSINDTLGHHAGDHLLQQFAHRLKTQIRPTDTVARLGGDEFAIILTNLTDPDQPIQTAQAILAAIRIPFDLPNRSGLNITTSIGIALAPTHTADPQKLRELADLAMYQAKSNGRNRYHI